ncbi:MAG: DUF2306 domain-containing protein [Bacteroidetes bacterium]|jgi:uncharacterized membrane protein|nr:DUF2306 domain-containing protein [Bacteroidota bacterium]
MNTVPTHSASLPKRLFQAALLIAYAYFCWLMLEISLQYIPINTDVAFLRIKQDEIALGYYKIAFFTHVFAAPLCLLAGFTQFSKLIRRKLPKVHRWSGWLYVTSVIGFAAPSGFVMGVHANGGWPSQLAFCLLGALWLIFTILAVKRAAQGDFKAHRAWMIRSFALALSAITLRAWKWILVGLFEPRPMHVYMLIAWLGWTLNLLVAEIIIRKIKQ